jgi:hypothetical protein
MGTQEESENEVEGCSRGSANGEFGLARRPLSRLVHCSALCSLSTESSGLG